jgi:hypothetical protein
MISSCKKEIVWNSLSIVFWIIEPQILSVKISNGSELCIVLNRQKTILGYNLCLQRVFTSVVGFFGFFLKEPPGLVPIDQIVFLQLLCNVLHF